MSSLQTYDGDSAWLGPEIAQRNDWIHTFSNREIAELATAADAVQDRKITALQASDFAMPAFDTVPVQIRDDVADGRNFVLLCGLPVTEWPRGINLPPVWPSVHL